MTTADANNPFAGFEAILTQDRPLAALTSYDIGGKARFFLEPVDIEQLAQVVRRASERGVPLRVMGGGNNLLVAAEYLDCAVASTGRINFVERHGATLVAGAGVDMGVLMRRCIDWGLAGLEVLAGIPGTLGGCVAMNAGGRHGQISDCIASLRVVTAGGEIVERAAGEIAFGYRKADLRGDVVAAAVLKLTPAPPSDIRRRFRCILDEKTGSQPYGERSAGCAFKNPPGRSAGQLIEQAGLKNASVGGAAVSPMHANFIVNRRGATAEDVLALIERVQREVKSGCGIDLELELDVWN